MSHVEITFKSGVTVNADVSEWGTSTTRVDKTLTGFEWLHDGPRKLSYVRVEEVVAVVFVDDEAES